MLSDFEKKKAFSIAKYSKPLLCVPFKDAKICSLILNISLFIYVESGIENFSCLFVIIFNRRNIFPKALAILILKMLVKRITEMTWHNLATLRFHGLLLPPFVVRRKINVEISELLEGQKFHFPSMNSSNIDVPIVYPYKRMLKKETGLIFLLHILKVELHLLHHSNATIASF